jgi:hypothetical protein
MSTTTALFQVWKERGKILETCSPPVTTVVKDVANSVVPYCKEFKLTLLLEDDEPIISGTTCDCVAQGQHVVVLTCTDECSYCRSRSSSTSPPQQESCTARTRSWRMIQQQAGGQTPSIVGQSLTYSYISGELEGSVVMVNTTSCSSGIDGDCATCRVRVNGVACRSCRPVTCHDVEEGNKPNGLDLDCRNTAANATSNT